MDNVGCLLVKTNFDNPDDPHQFKKQKLEPSSFLLLNKFSKFAFGDEKYVIKNLFDLLNHKLIYLIIIREKEQLYQLSQDQLQTQYYKMQVPQ